MKLTFRLKGGKGSGHFGHRGRPGKQGGGLPEGSYDEDDWEEDEDQKQDY